MEFSFGTLMMVLLGASLVGAFMEESSRRQKKAIEQLSLKLDQVLAAIAER